MYLIEILHQTTTSRRRHKRKKALYLIEILHQTTTFSQSISTRNGCILSKFYIKPQLTGRTLNGFDVVSYRNSTSNHNSGCDPSSPLYVVSYRNSTSNHNIMRVLHDKFKVVSYRNSTSNHNLKPSHFGTKSVVSYRNSTSNHNCWPCHHEAARVVSYRNSTSNHNYFRSVDVVPDVVSYRNSTSNHNPAGDDNIELLLYLIEILHQTTTQTIQHGQGDRCILSKFYIKPQRRASY